MVLNSVVGIMAVTGLGRDDESMRTGRLALESTLIGVELSSAIYRKCCIAHSSISSSRMAAMTLPIGKCTVVYGLAHRLRGAMIETG